MFAYNSKTGVLTDSAGNVLTTGYSGTHAGRNNPDMENVQNVGPIPRGEYKIGPAYNDPHLGPCVMHLDPLPGTNTFGRSLFRIHGNDKENDASHGCVIIQPTIRQIISKSTDRILHVT